MTIPAQRRSESIKLSVNYYLEHRPALVAVVFNFQDFSWSPDANSATKQWVNVSPITEMAGAKGAYIAQMDVYGRTREDQYRQRIDRIKDKICNALNVNRIKIYDFTDPAHPCDTGKWLIPQNSDGKVGEREECRWMDEEAESGTARCVLRFRFVCLADLSGGRYCPSKG